MPSETKSTVLVVDDSASFLALVKRHLSNAGYIVLTATNGVEALEIVRTQGVQLVVTDWEMPEMDGLELCRAIRAADGLGFVCIIVLTSRSEKSHLIEAFDAGADDFLSKPFDRQELLARLRAGDRVVRLEACLAERTRALHKINAEIAVANERLRMMATTDELTGLLNRREAMVRLGELWAAAERYGRPLSCIMLDIDHFKRCNDQYGHAVGDLVLKEISAIMRSVSRVPDVVCRLGGEEFLILCPDIEVDCAAVLAERLRRATEAHDFHCDDHHLRVTVSLGVGQRDEHMARFDELLKTADDALYQAKRSGRNRVCSAASVREEAVTPVS